MSIQSEAQSLAATHESLCARVAGHGGEAGITERRHRLKDACAKRMEKEISAGMVSPIKSRAQIEIEYRAEQAAKAEALKAAGL